MPNPHLWNELLTVARWAPSPHNTQPWLLRPTGDSSADLFMLRSRRLPDEDTTGCFLICAMGIFIEALRIAASNRALRLEAALEDHLDLSQERIPFARLTLSPGASPDEYPDTALLERRTSRLVPDSRALTADQFAALHAAAAPFGHAVRGVSDPAAIRRILDRNIDAVLHDLADPKYGGEIARWYRYTASHASRTRDGLEARCMNMPALTMWLSARAPWMLRTPLLRAIMRSAYRRMLGGAPALILIQGDFFDHRAAAASGAMLLRLWLRMHTMGLAMHPFGNLVTNAAAHAWLTNTTGIDRIWLVARIGHTATPPRSHRLRTEEILCTDA